ncbi:Uncharacterized protein Adt_35977 [Abeliophyllum distichum]|uniref:Uncharacterized protein n=1 Tax=Abeliophyllum distichum TaxID=126358 RepID=A0ABD1QK50_9LAMI
MAESQRRASSGNLKEKNSLLGIWISTWMLILARYRLSTWTCQILISLPHLKKIGKSSEKSKEESANGNNKANADHFSFALDFEELGNFSFESSSTKEGTKAEKNKDSEIFSKRSEYQDEKGPSHTKFIENMSTSKNELFEKPLSPGNATTSDMDTQVDRSAGIHSPSEKSPSKLVMDDIGSSNFSTAIYQVASQKERMSLDKPFSSSRQQNICQFEKTVSPEPIHQEACITNVASQDLSAHSVSGDEASQITGSQLQEVGTMDTNLTSSIGEQNVMEKTIADSDSSSKNTKVENSYPQAVAVSETNDGEESQVGTENHSFICNKERIEHGQGDSIVQNSSITSVVTGSKKTNSENQGPTSDIPKAPLISKPVDNFMSEKERGPLVTRSRFFMGPDKPEPYVQKAPSAQTTASSLSSKKMSLTQPSLLDEKSNQDTKDDVDDGTLASFPLQHSRAARREHHQPRNLESCKGVTIDRKGTGADTSADGSQDGIKLNVSFPTQDQDVVEGKSAPESQKNAKNVDTFSLSVQMSKTTPQNHPNPRISASTITSLFTMKNSSAEVEKSSPVNSGRRNPNPCGLNLSRNSGSDVDSSKSVSHKDVKCLGNSTQNQILLGNEPSKITHSASDKASLSTRKSTCAEAKQFTQVNTGGRNLDLCGLRLSRTSESDHDLTRSVGHKDVNSLGNITQNKLWSGNESSSSTRGTLKKTPSPPSLKRKTLEEFNASMMLLNPSKRLSQSPSGQQVSNHENQEDGSTKRNFDDCQDSTLDAPHEMNMKELDAPFSVENNTYVGQAEACTKELEDICNMLSKKHEEAKEILVRAIVNNNKLLMLNHPLL